MGCLHGQWRHPTTTGTLAQGCRSPHSGPMVEIAGNCVGVVLAGGLARRMGGGDKCLLALAGRPLMAHVIERAEPQVGRLILNANGDPGRFTPFGLPVVADVVEDFLDDAGASGAAAVLEDALGFEEVVGGWTGG